MPVGIPKLKTFPIQNTNGPRTEHRVPRNWALAAARGIQAQGARFDHPGCCSWARANMVETQVARLSPDQAAGQPDHVFTPSVARRRASPPSNKNKQGGLPRETKKKEMPPAAEYCIFHAICDGRMETVSPFVHFNSTQKAVLSLQRWTSGMPDPTLFSILVLCVPSGSAVFNLFQRLRSGVGIKYLLILCFDEGSGMFFPQFR